LRASVGRSAGGDGGGGKGAVRREEEEDLMMMYRGRATERREKSRGRVLYALSQ